MTRPLRQPELKASKLEAGNEETGRKIIDQGEPGDTYYWGLEKLQV